MFSKVRFQALLIVVVALAVIWFIGDHFGMRAKERTFHDVVMSVDTADISGFSITAHRKGREPLHFHRAGDQWRLVVGRDTLRVENEAVNKVLFPLGDLRVKRLVGTMDLVKDRYDLSDTLREELTLHLTDGSTRQLLVGSSTFSPKGPWSHVNVVGEKEVYAVEGELSMATQMNAVDWRPHTVVSGDPKYWTRVHFTFPGNDYTFERTSAGWMMDGLAIDTARVSKYLASLANSDAHFFADGARIEGLPVLGQLEITDTSRPGPIVVRIHPGPEGRFILYSSVNPENLMWFDAQRELPRLFRPRENWFVGATPAGPGL